MSKKIYLFSLVLLALAFVSCSETEEEGKFANWRARNEAFLDSLQQVYDAKTDPELEFFVPFTDPGMKIFYKRTVKNDEGRRPVIPNVVSAYYRGYLIIQVRCLIRTLPEKILGTLILQQNSG